MSRRLSRVLLLNAAVGAIVLSGWSITGPSASVAASWSAESDVFSPHSRPFGASFGRWSARYWQVLMDTPVDQYSSACVMDERRGVAFLVTSGGSPLTLECRIEPGTPLFAPIVTIGLWCPVDCDEEFNTFEDLSGYARDFIDGIDVQKSLSLEIDGKPLRGIRRFRARSPEFEGFIHPDSELGLLGLPSGPVGPAAADGYWVMIKPLERGRHVILILADLVEDFGFELETTIKVTVGRSRRH
jgi:hypothetical protein